MKKLYSLIALFTISATMVLNAQNRIVQIMKDGNVLQSYPVEQIDSIIIVEEFTPEFTPEAVDLGLSVKWASCNVGATSPEEYGGYYAWGETEEKSSYDIENHIGEIYGVAIGEYFDNGVPTRLNISGTSYDVAHVKWGNGWRMPTKDEAIELIENCSWEYLKVNGIYCEKVTGPNGNSIYLPYAGSYYGTTLSNSHRPGSGCYWISAVSDHYFIPLVLMLGNKRLGDWESGSAMIEYYGGASVRPVKD